MASMLDQAEKQLKSHLGSSSGVQVTRKDMPKFTDDQKKRVKEAQARLRALLGDK